MTQDLYNIIVGIAGTAIGWMMKVVWESVRALQEDMKAIEREIHTKYVSRAEFKDDIQELKEMCRAIFERLDRKVDKG
jgi:hypothetical protein